MTDAPKSPFASAAPVLAAMGYHVLPILPPTVSHAGRGKAPGQYTGGHWHGMPKWQAVRDKPGDSFSLDLWTRYPNANIGVVLGSPIGPLRLIAIDVDAVDADALRDILGALPHSPMVKRGSKGETRFYAASPDIKTGVYDGPDGRLVDLLTGFDTRQTVMPPSHHPDGPVYHWLAGPVPAVELPEFTADDLTVLEETLSTLGWVPKGQRKASEKRPQTSDSLPDADDFFTETKVAALANMEAWVHDLDVYGLRPARGGYEAVATWRASSTGRPIAQRKRNLSIQREGIKDFGTNWTGSAIDLVMEANGLDQAAATSWLRVRLGLTGDVMVLEPRSHTKPMTSADSVKPGLAFTPHAEPAIAAPVAVKAPVIRRKDTAELPDALTRVPGLVGRITDWITDAGNRPQRGLALGAALTLVGTAAGRKFGGPTSSGTHLYILSLAPTGAGKDAALEAISRILDASDMKAHKGPSKFKSDTAVINLLVHKPLSLCSMDEFGSFLKKINSKKAGGHELEISGIFRTAWGKSFKSFMTPASAAVQEVEVIAPSLSIYGASTPAEFYAAVEGDDVFNGFLNRFLIISTTKKPPKRDPLADPFDVPAEISQGMLDIYQAGGPLLGASSHATVANKPAIVVPWDCPQAKRVYDRLDEEIDAMEDGADLWSRTAEIAVRAATNLAIGTNSQNPRITVEDIEWGVALARWSAERMASDATAYMSENEHQTTAMQILRVIKERGPIKKGDLLRAMQNRLRATAMDEHLRWMIDAGQIKDETERPPSGGTTIHRYSSAEM